MLGLVIVVCISTIVGPALSESRAKNDKLIESYLPNVSIAINSYASKNNKLPASLNDISLTADAKKLVELNLVEYKPQTNATSYNQKSTTTNNQTYDPYSSYSSRYSYTFNYDLCVNYVREKKGSSYYPLDDTQYQTSTRNTSPSTYYHKKGNVCYELKTGY